MTNAITSMTTTITPVALWEQVAEVMPFVSTLVIFGFGFYLVRKAIKGARNGKPRV